MHEIYQQKEKKLQVGHSRIPTSYCKHSGVTYDLLVGNIGGTYDLAIQLPSICSFGHFLLVLKFCTTLSP